VRSRAILPRMKATPQGRKPRYQEFLQTLQEVTELSTPDLAKAIGKKQTNLLQYLNGAIPTGRMAVQSAIRHLAEWRLTPRQEVQLLPNKMTFIPEAGGIYALFDSAGNALYVGQATNLRAEIVQTLGRRANFPVRRGPNLSKKQRPKYRELVHFLSAYEVPSPRLRHNLEALILRIFPNQSHNNKLGKFR
jgi:hypothetical protein